MMKKIYIRPSLITVNLSVRKIMLQGSLTPDGATFYDDNADSEAMTKGVVNNKNVWDNEW